jgi:photosystem II stability/assembly factor-like uncharacterized protein
MKQSLNCRCERMNRAVKIPRWYLEVDRHPVSLFSLFLEIFSILALLLVTNRAYRFLRICFPRRWVSYLLIGLFSIAAALGQSAPWNSVGPDGGDARSIAAIPGDPAHLFLGTTNSWIYESTDSGVSWHRLAKLESTDDLVIDHIVVDSANPAILYVAAWTLGHPGGGLWMSRDGGKNWNQSAGLSSQSIRAFVQARSNPAMLFAGTLEGVFRSSDGGAMWEQISPKGSLEIHEIESLAVDPVNPDIVYAGTWHLPWKTTDGGKNWHNIKKGMIDDSDVFSIIVDPEKPSVVYASACSGIYKSNNGGELFRKIQGISCHRAQNARPAAGSGAPRRVVRRNHGRALQDNRLRQDLQAHDQSGCDRERREHRFRRSKSRFARDGSGRRSCKPRWVRDIRARERRNLSTQSRCIAGGTTAIPQRIFAGVVNDKTYGSVFVSSGSGMQWKQVADGLDGRDVFALAQSPEGTVLAGTNRGIFALEPDAAAWQPRNLITYAPAETTTVPVSKTRVDGKKRLQAKPQAREKSHATDQSHEMDGRVFALDLSGDAWLASTSGGLYTSKDKGATWQGGPVIGVVGYLSVASDGALMAAARPDAVVVSQDAGQNWWPVSIPIALTRIHRVAFSPDGTLWIGGREGVYFTRDKGKSWMWVHRLPMVDIDDLYYDAQLGKVLVSSRGSDFVYAIDAVTLDWKWWQTGYKLSAVRAVGGRLLAASLEDGVLMEPRSGEAEIGRR